MLTGLANARTLQRVMELEIARAARQGSELTVAIFDVDDLTGYNDANGRTAGDDALREVAAIIGESVRFVDTVARWGGDEFMVVAPGAKGTTVARRIVEAVAARSTAPSDAAPSPPGWPASRWTAPRATTWSRPRPPPCTPPGRPARGRSPRPRTTAATAPARA